MFIIWLAGLLVYFSIEILEIKELIKLLQQRYLHLSPILLDKCQSFTDFVSENELKDNITFITDNERKYKQFDKPLHLFALKMRKR
jgi:uncharacterized protein YfbU (UPF0304 family)